MQNRRQRAPPPAGCRPSGGQRDAEDTAGYIGLATVVEGLDVVGQRGQDMPAKAARCHHVVGVAGSRSLHHNFVFSRIDHQAQGGIRQGRANQPGAHLVHRQPQVGHGVEIQVLEGADGADQGAQQRQVLQAGSNVQLDGADTALAPLGG